MEAKPITKKEACEILNISYNTTRLQKIIDDFLERKEYTQKRKSQNRGRAATSDEIKTIAQDYLEGDNISEIAKRLYRSPSFVKAVIDRLGVPEKVPMSSRSPIAEYLPDNCMSESFSVGERVWSATHNAPAEIVKEMTLDFQAKAKGLESVDYEKKYASKAYQIYVFETGSNSDSFSSIENGGFYAYAAAYDLGSLKHLEKYGVSV